MSFGAEGVALGTGSVGTVAATDPSSGAVMWPRKPWPAPAGRDLGRGLSLGHCLGPRDLDRGLAPRPRTPKACLAGRPVLRRPVGGAAAAAAEVGHRADASHA